MPCTNLISLATGMPLHWQLTSREAKLVARTRVPAERFAKGVPLFAPFLGIYQGVVLAARGKGDGVVRIRAAIDDARRIGVPFEAALGTWELHRLGHAGTADVVAAFAAVGPNSWHSVIAR